MKKILVAVSALFVALSTSPAFAAPNVNFVNLYTVSAAGSQIANSVFGFNQTPYLYLEVLDAGISSHATIFSDWKFSSTILDSENAVGGNNVKKFWLSPLNWNSIKQVGQWDVDASYRVNVTSNNQLMRFGSGTAKFTVTPEPVSASLFILGAGALAARGLRKKK